MLQIALLCIDWPAWTCRYVGCPAPQVTSNGRSSCDPTSKSSVAIHPQSSVVAATRIAQRASEAILETFHTISFNARTPPAPRQGRRMQTEQTRIRCPRWLSPPLLSRIVIPISRSFPRWVRLASAKTPANIGSSDLANRLTTDREEMRRLRICYQGPFSGPPLSRFLIGTTDAVANDVGRPEAQKIQYSYAQ